MHNFSGVIQITPLLFFTSRLFRIFVELLTGALNMDKLECTDEFRELLFAIPLFQDLPVLSM